MLFNFPILGRSPPLLIYLGRTAKAYNEFFSRFVEISDVAFYVVRLFIRNVVWFVSAASLIRLSVPISPSRLFAHFDIRVVAILSLSPSGSFNEYFSPISSVWLHGVAGRDGV